MPTAIDRPDFPAGGGTAELAALYTRQRQRDPSFRAPQGYEWKGDHYERDMHPWYDTAAKYAPLVGLGIGGGVALAGGLGAAGAGGAGAAGAGGAGGAGAAGAGAGSYTLGAGAAGAGAAGAGGAGAGLGAGAAGAAGLGGVLTDIYGTGAGPEMIQPGITSTMSPSTIASLGGSGGLGSWLSNPSNWSNLLSTAGDVGNVLGNTAKGAAEGRHLDALLNNQQDAIRSQQYGTEQNAQMNLGTLDVARQKFSEDARGSRGKQAAIGNLLQNIQDVSLNVPGIARANISGGLRPSALGAGGRTAGGELARQAMLKMMTPDTFTGGEILKPPPLTPIPQPSTMENVGATSGIVGNILGALGQWRQPRPITSTAR